jgi:PEP-CTERM motif
MIICLRVFLLKGISMKPSIFFITLAVSSLFGIQPALADQISLNGWWGGNSWDAHIDFNGTNYHTGTTVSPAIHEGGGAGGFNTTNLTRGGASFQSWCVDIFHSFSFPAVANDTLVSAASVFNPTKANDLGRLYTAHHAAVEGHDSSNTNSAAFQLAVWEIVNETGTSYGLNNGFFQASGTGAGEAQTWLSTLNATPVSAYNVSIWSVNSMVSGWGHAQDVAVFAPVPEPETYAMLLAGLGVLSGVVRRRKFNRV